ncbi:MAG TPA: type IX secretion system sortase PorU [Bacteroidales bacterium]|nr:type IX secretion system sortase PorU [Bacteroidales bacterium]
MRFKPIIVLLLLLCTVHVLTAQSLPRRIDGFRVSVVKYTDTDSLVHIGFNGAVFTAESGMLPVYLERLDWDPSWQNPEVRLSNMIFDVLDNADERMIPDLAGAGQEITVRSVVTYEKKKPFLTYSFIPVRKNPWLGIYEKLTSFQVEVISGPSPASIRQASSRTYSASSLLASGNWYKFAVKETGIHKITYSQLTEMGIAPSSIDPRNIRIFGYGGRMMPENSSEARYDDMLENSIYISGEEDGRMDPQDYILFHGEGPVTWTYDYFSEAFEHTNHLYADESCYFITCDLGPGKRIKPLESTSEPATETVNSFNDYASHEIDDVNLVKSGRVWLGETFDVVTEYQFPFEFPNIDKSTPVKLKTHLVARSTISSSFRIQAADQSQVVNISAILSSYNSLYAREAITTTEFLPLTPQVDVSIKYNKTTATSIGWLNYIEINARRALSFTGNQLAFRDARSSGPGRVAEYTLSDASSAVTIWDVTTPYDIREVKAKSGGTNLTFRLPSDTIRQFVAFTGNDFPSVSFIQKVDNQNLHAIGKVDYILITPEEFLETCNRLAQFHIERNGLIAVVVLLPQIYNEFSSGMQDITAIRDFVKMLYDRSGEGNEPRYLLLFGDGSYDNKNRLSGNTNLVPTYQSAESFSPVISYVTDDYYGILDDGEGTGENDMLDIGVGRLPVATIEEATVAVDKIFHYATSSSKVMGDWRNVVTFVADDEDSNIHLDDADNLAIYVDSNYTDYNVNKIYLDSYTQVSTPGGQRYPDVNAAINDQVEKGALIINYTGHGGEVGWAHERVLEVADINSWINYDRMPVFVTATCEFSRFDDPARTSAGEFVFLNRAGGGLALFTTTRATFGSPNYSLNKSFYSYAFRKIDGHFPTMGDIILYSKRQSGSDNNGRKFVLLGDPAQRLAYPEYDVVATAINSRPTSGQPDTISALSTVSITGEIRDAQGRIMPGFNGTLNTTVFDKPQTVTTLGNDGGSTRGFDVQKSILYKGKSTVVDGIFEFSFIVPKDIAYKFDFGKISFYAEDGACDANGYFSDIIIGGFDEAASADTAGPSIDLYMNNVYFRNGGITDQNPVLLALVDDESGINTVGNGIGHDIVAILDENTDELKVLNDYYQANLNTYRSGVITYPYFNLSEGSHHIRLKVWDAFNNSSEAIIHFVVKNSDDMVMEDPLNYPNPFTDRTWFTYEVNHVSEGMEVGIFIYDLVGQLVMEIHREENGNGYRPEPIMWDGNDQHGNPLRGGLYIYRIRIRDNTGAVSETSNKLVIIR